MLYQVFAPGVAVSMPSTTGGLDHEALIVQHNPFGESLIFDNHPDFNVGVRGVILPEGTKLVHYQPAYPWWEILERGNLRLRDTYNPVFFNCQHFTSWCITGEAKSNVVRGVIAVTALAAATAYLGNGA